MFGRLTPADLVLMVEGHAARSELADYRLAWHASLMLAINGETKSPEDLMGRKLKYLLPAKPDRVEYPGRDLARALGA